MTMTNRRLSTLLIGTRNPGKIREIKEALNELPVTFRTLEELGISQEPQENGLTYEENASIKAEFYSSIGGCPALADDSGLEVFALGNRPGLYSARYGGFRLADSERCDLLLSEMKSVSDRRAMFWCAFALTYDGITRTVTGQCSGTIAIEPAGGEGFGFDPIFIPDGFDLTFAQLPAEVKATISHRARALIGVKQLLQSILGYGCHLP